MTLVVTDFRGWLRQLYPQQSYLRVVTLRLGDRLTLSSLEVSAFPNSNNQLKELEQSIGNVLWDWSNLDDQERNTIFIGHSPFHVTLEYYLSSIFGIIEFTRVRSIWCDGVKHLRVEQLHRRAFRIIGAIYGPVHLAPFELEFEFVSKRADLPKIVVLRLGNSSPEGEILWRNVGMQYENVVSMRPTHNNDWAVAVELTQSDSDAG